MGHCQLPGVVPAFTWSLEESGFSFITAMQNYYSKLIFSYSSEIGDVECGGNECYSVLI